MITFTDNTTRYTVKPENAQAIRATLTKPFKHKPVALTSKNLVREYPAFKPGMTTEDYCAAFQGLNSRLMLTAHRFNHANRAAPMLDGSIPEVFEELDPDWTPGEVTAKKPSQTVAGLKRQIRQALDLLASGDIDTAQCVLAEAIK